MQTRLDCKYSFATDDNKNLRCEICDSICDGPLYDCCLWDKSYDEQMAIIAEDKNNDR